MENVNYSKNIKSAKEILNKLLSEKLGIRLTNLELINEQEMSNLSKLSSTSKNIISNLNKYSNKIKNKEKEIKVPKLKLGEINKTTSNNNNHNQKSNKKEEKNSNEFDSILKNTKFKSKRNKEKPLSLIFNNETSKTISGIFDKNENNKQFMTCRNIKKKDDKINKTFVKFDINNNIIYGKNKHKTKLKNTKCLTDRTNKEGIPSTPIRLNTDKEFCKKLKSNNKDGNSTYNTISVKTPQTIKKQTKIRKKVYKTIANFYSNNKKENENHPFNPRASLNIKTPDKLLVDKEIKKHERNLKSLCESMLIDVNRDELLVNDNKIIFSGSIPELTNKNENKNQNKLDAKLKNCIQYILIFLTIGEINKLCRTKKEILKLIINLLINKTEKSIENINSILKTHNSNNKEELILLKKQKLFELNLNSQKAISLLNSISKINFIKSIKSFNNNINKNKDSKKIILIFDLYLISIGKKIILNNLNSDNNKKIEFICNYFKNNKTKLIGNIIENDLKNIKFDDFIINSLYEYSKEYIDIINPNYYKKINRDIAIFVFIIKNILDFIGISNIKSDFKNNEQKLILIHKSRLNTQNLVLDKLNQILNKFN